MLTPPRAPHGICVAPRDLWANSPTCFFKRIGRLVVSHRSLRFAQMHFTSSLRKNPCSSVAPAAHQKPSSRTRSKSKESVKRPIRAHRWYPCFLINHPAWHLCCSVRSVGDPKHPAWPFPIPHPKETLNIQHPTSHIINILLCNIRYTPVIFMESQK